MRRGLEAIVTVVLAGSCGPATTPPTGSESTVADGPETGETETETETGEPAPAVAVRWIEVAASDYKLELVPEFEAEITAYEALADGPDIAVWVDVIVDADVDGVLVDGEPATLVGFRTWRSPAEPPLISPTFVTVEVLAGEVTVPTYTIDVVAPGG